MSQKSDRRRRRTRGFTPQGGLQEVPFLVKLAVSNRVGSQLTRNEAVSRAMTLGALSAVTFIASFFFSIAFFGGLIFFSVVALAFAFGQWRAISWLDEHKAWRSFRH